MAIDRRKKLLKHLRLVRYDAFEKVCAELGITYTFPPEYYRRVTRRWLAKKAFCIKVTTKLLILVVVGVSVYYLKGLKQVFHFTLEKELSKTCIAAFVKLS